MNGNARAAARQEAYRCVCVRTRPSMRLLQAPRPGKEYMRTDGKIYLPKNIDTDRPMEVSTKDSLMITFHKKVPTAYTVADVMPQPVAAS